MKPDQKTIKNITKLNNKIDNLKTRTIFYGIVREEILKELKEASDDISRIIINIHRKIKKVKICGLCGEPLTTNPTMCIPCSWTHKADD